MQGRKPSHDADDAQAPPTPGADALSYREAEPAEIADDSLLGVIGADESLATGQIDSALDMLVSSVDLAEVPAVDWDTPI